MKENILFTFAILLMALCSSSKVWADEEQGKAYVTLYTNESELHFYYCPPGTTNTVSPDVGPTYEIEDYYYWVSDLSHYPGWLDDNKNWKVKKAVFEPSFANYSPKSTAYWFYLCYALES